MGNIYDTKAWSALNREAALAFIQINKTDSLIAGPGAPLLALLGGLPRPDGPFIPSPGGRFA